MQPMSRLPRFATALLLTAGSLLSLSVHADEAHYNQVALRAEVSQEIAHDLMHVTFYTESQNTDPAALAAETTQTLNAALKQARAVEGVSVATGSRNSYPVYDDKGKKIIAWRERAEVRLESADFAKLSKLTGEMLKTMQMGSMSFSIADNTRKNKEDAMLKDAVEAFKARADLATQALGGKGYKLVSLNINSGGFQPPMPIRMARGSSMKMMMDSAPPEVEAGTSQVTVNADGVIEVQMP